MNGNTFLHFIGGRFVDSESGRQFEKRSPVDGSLIGMVAEAGQREVDAAVRAATEAMAGPWGKLTLAQRTDMLHAVAREIDRRFDDFLDAEVNDTGKPRSVASHVDIPRGAANFRIFADAVKNVPTEFFEMQTPEGRQAFNYSLRVPKGVIAVVCPWNLPLLLMTWKVAPALACGNTIVAKPSEETPGTATLLAEVMHEAGVPPGVFNLVHGFGAGATGEALVKSAGIDALTFTGESSTGATIMRQAADGVRPVSFELGGKNAAVVFADCDFDQAVAGVARSSFLNSGQVCLCTERVYVERPIFDRFVAALAEKAEAMRIGDPWDSATDLGPLISRQHRDKVLGYLALARAEGAHVHAGGGVPDLGEALNRGFFVQPTVWTGLAQSSRTMQEEVFGPVCHVMPFDTEDEALTLANDSRYGLAASIWTTRLDRAHRMAGRLVVGLVWLNTWFLRDLRTPFGGARLSGLGREGGHHSLDFYSELKNVCVKL
jgi:aminomuconate-semialdehyde/2-hydroxymuconate-6-semialdehyde dehydrogenase